MADSRKEDIRRLHQIRFGEPPRRQAGATDADSGLGGGGGGVCHSGDGHREQPCRSRRETQKPCTILGEALAKKRSAQLAPLPRQPHSCANWRGLEPWHKVGYLSGRCFCFGGVLSALRGKERSGPAAAAEVRAAGPRGPEAQATIG